VTTLNLRTRGNLANLLILITALKATPAFPADPESQTHNEAFLRGYISSILEREMGWERGSYDVSVRDGAAVITVIQNAELRAPLAKERLRSIEGIRQVEFRKPEEAAPRQSIWRGIGVATARVAGATGEVEGFPAGDVFAPLLADEKQPRFSVSWRHYYLPGRSTNVGAVAYGEEFGLLRVRGESRGDGFQVGIVGGLFAQFDLNAPSNDLINADYTIGGAATYRQGTHSARLRVYHQSSHLGDEFVLRVHTNRVNLTYESLEFLYARDFGDRRSWTDLHEWRAYIGGEYLLQREPDLKRAIAHGGIEYYGKEPLFWSGRLVSGLDLKANQENDLALDVSFKAGLEFGDRGPGGRKLRLLAEAYRGFSPHGQFYADRIRYLGLGLYLGF
jgi:hypothetical protein